MTSTAETQAAWSSVASYSSADDVVNLRHYLTSPDSSRA